MNRKTTHKAWCWATGLIQIGAGPVPDGAILIATGPAVALGDELDVVARHGKGAGAGKLLVPGVPEAETKAEALINLGKWLEWCALGRTRGGVKFITAGNLPKEQA